MGWTTYLKLCLPCFRDLLADTGTTHSQREGWDLLPSLLVERGQFQRGPGGASSDEEGVWECGREPTGPRCAPTELSASPGWMTSSAPWEKHSSQTHRAHLSHLNCTWQRYLLLKHADGQSDSETYLNFLVPHYCDDVTIVYL